MCIYNSSFPIYTSILTVVHSLRIESGVYIYMECLIRLLLGSDSLGPFSTSSPNHSKKQMFFVSSLRRSDESVQNSRFFF